MKTQSMLKEELKTQIANQKQNVEKLFYYVNEEDLNAKPSEKNWSALQCFEHMNLCNAHYIREIRSVLDKVKPLTSDKPFRSGIIGGYMIKSMKPKDGAISNPMKTFAGVRPLAEREKNSEVIVKPQPTFTDFFADLKEYDRIIDVLSDKDMQSAKIKSLIGNFIKFKVGDALLFMLAHNDRHIIQATNALNQK